jgi:DNA (cytosine-5)-methyltransferase 1
MHLFAGIGGGLLADLILGHNPIVAVEWDKYACKVLREGVSDGWFDGMQVYEGDVRLFDPSEYKERVDCIHAGFPCQDISNAGKQAGVGEGTRSGLYREVLRIADLVRPGFIFLENVSAILSNGLGTVLADLAALGYDAKWICVRASDVGANHQRDRWWLLAKLGNAKHDGQFTIGDKQELSGITDGTQGEVEQSTGSSDRQKNMANSTGIGQSRSREYVGQIGTTQDSDRQADRIVNGSEGNKGWWELEPELGRLAYGISDRVGKLKGLGNAQVPLQAAVAFSMLMELYQ